MKRFCINLTAVAIVVLSTVGVSVVHAQEAASSPKQAQAAIKFRQSLFQLIRSNVGPLGAMARGKMPYDPALMSKNAERMMQLSAMVPDYLRLDTSMYDVGTDAKKEIWQNLSDVNQKAKNLYDATAALKAVADAKDESQYKSAIAAVTKTCKACHDKYKED